MVEEDLNNDIILYSGFSVDIFSNTDIKVRNQVLYLSTNVGAKINQMQVMVLLFQVPGGTYFHMEP